MPAPTTTDQLLTNLRKSGLVDAGKLDKALSAAPFGESPSAFLARLVDQGTLTRYQADKLAVGKYKGFVLGPYIILDRLGGGGMGHVFLAEHSAMRRQVAIKVLSVGSMNDPVALERFFREARVAAGLDHPNLCRVFDLRREDAICYLVMEYVEGESLQHIVSRHGPLAWRTAANYARQIAVGLQYAHEFGLVHRDIKPANLLLSRDGLVKIIDLGLVRWEAEVDSKLTEKVDQSILGTADYLAPEQAVNSSDVDIRADIYSLGATLYYLIAGRTIFPDGKTAQKLMWQQLKEPTPIRNLEPSVPEGLAAAVHKCLSKNPDDRYPLPRDVAAALEPWCGADASPDPAWMTSRGRGSRVLPAPPDSRLISRRPGIESTMLPPLKNALATSSHLFDATKSRPLESNKATRSDMGEETPLRMPLPEKLPTRSTVNTSRVYERESELEAPKRSNSPLLLAIFIAVLALLAVGVALLVKAI